MAQIPNIISRENYTDQQTVPPSNSASGWGYWDSLTEAPPASVYGVGYAWIGGRQYWSNGIYWRSKGTIASGYPYSSSEWVFAGDSITALNYRLGTDATRLDNKGFVNYADLLSYGAIGNYINAGVSGEDSSELLARYATTVCGKGARFHHILIGTNDIVRSVQPDTAGNIEAMINMSMADGAELVILGTPPARNYPDGSAGYTFNATAKAYHIRAQSIRESIFTLAQKYGLPVADYYSATIARDTVANGASGFPHTNFMINSAGELIHPSFLGAYNMGAVLADIVNAQVRPRLFKTGQYNAAFGTTLGVDNGFVVTANPLMAGTAGTAGTGVTGTGAIPDNFTVARTAGSISAVCTLVPRSSVPSKVPWRGGGNALKIAISGSASVANGDIISVSPTRLTLPGPGITHVMECELCIVPGANSAISRLMLGWDFTTNVLALNGLYNGNTDNMVLPGIEGVLRSGLATTVGTAGNGFGSLYINSCTDTGAAGGTLDVYIGRFGLYQLN